jgi:glycosyltransferase involved in cell wall biosynthesis
MTAKPSQECAMSGVDIVIPCYQYGRFLRDSVGSILQQSFGKVRILIVDNASTDNSVEVAQQLAKEDRRVEIVAHKTNLGQQRSYNEGIDWAAAEYFMILDADDLLAPACLSRAVALMEEERDIVLVHGAERRIASDGHVDFNEAAEPEDIRWKVESGLDFIGKLCTAGYNFVNAPTVVRRTSAQKIIGYYPEGIRYANDMNMWLRLATLGKVAETASTLGIRRLHGRQMTHFYRENRVFDFIEHLNNFRHFFANEGAQIPHSSREAEKVAKVIGGRSVYVGLKQLARGRVRQGVQCLEFGVKAWLDKADPYPTLLRAASDR